MDSDQPPEDTLPRVGDEFHSKSGLEHAAESVRKASVGAFAALVAALAREVDIATKAVLSAEERELATARGRLQQATVTYERIRHYEQTLSGVLKRQTATANRRTAQ
jgi:hypothetical protein